MAKSDFAKRMGMKLKLARISAELSRAAVAERLGVSQEAVRTWEIGGHSPGPETLETLAKFYGVPAGYFFGEISSDLDRAREQGKTPTSGRVLVGAH